MKTEAELNEMSDEQLFAYFNQRFKNKSLNDTEDYIYVARSEPCAHHHYESAFRDEELIDMYKRMGYRIIKCKVIELINPGSLGENY